MKKSVIVPALLSVLLQSPAVSAQQRDSTNSGQEACEAFKTTLAQDRADHGATSRKITTAGIALASAVAGGGGVALYVGHRIDAALMKQNLREVAQLSELELQSMAAKIGNLFFESKYVAEAETRILSEIRALGSKVVWIEGGSAPQEVVEIVRRNLQLAARHWHKTNDAYSALRAAQIDAFFAEEISDVMEGTLRKGASEGFLRQFATGIKDYVLKDMLGKKSGFPGQILRETMDKFLRPRIVEGIVGSFPHETLARALETTVRATTPTELQALSSRLKRYGKAGGAAGAASTVLFALLWPSDAQGATMKEQLRANPGGLFDGQSQTDAERIEYACTWLKSDRELADRFLLTAQAVGGNGLASRASVDPNNDGSPSVSSAYDFSTEQGRRDAGTVGDIQRAIQHEALKAGAGK